MTISDIFAAIALVISVVALWGSFSKARYEKKKDKEDIIDRARIFIRDNKIEERFSQAERLFPDSSRDSTEKIFARMAAISEVEELHKLSHSVQQEIFRQLNLILPEQRKLRRKLSNWRIMRRNRKTIKKGKINGNYPAQN